MGVIQNTMAAVATRFGYEAVKPSPTRGRTKIEKRSEDRVLSKLDRAKLHAKSADLKRNMAVAAWAIRTHCAHVAQHTFQSRTGDEKLDRQIERLMTRWSRAENCDTAGRHSLDRLIYLAETSRVEAGDVFLVMTRDGQLQAIESDRVGQPDEGQPKGFNPDDYVHGIKIDPYGRAECYVLNRRSKSGRMEFVTQINARDVFHHGYFDRIDQVRGISPLASALNHFQDIHEAQDYALAKAKVSQLLILKIKHAEIPEEKQENKPIRFDAPNMMHVYGDDDSSVMDMDTPGTGFQEYMRQMLMSALKALDLDFSFFDSSHTNYSGSRQALLMYRRSARIRQQEVQAMRRWITERKLRQWHKEGLIVLPAGGGGGITDAADLAFEWVPVGIGWVDPLKEVRAQVAALESGLTSRQAIVRERDGGDWFDIVKQLQDEEAEIARRGVVLSSDHAAAMPAVAAEDQAQAAAEENQA